MTRKLNIVIPIHSFEPGGVERVALNLAAAWQDIGHNVTVVLGRNEGPGAAGAPQLNYQMFRNIVPTAAFETIWMTISLYRCLRQNPDAILFCPGNTYSIVCVAMRLLLQARCPLIVAKMSNDLIRKDFWWPVRFGYHLWLRVQGAYLHRLVGMAEPMRPEIASTMRVASDKISIIPDPALSQEQFNELSSIGKKAGSGWGTHFLAAGRLVPQKNFNMLIRAFANYNWSHDRLVIAGDGPERKRLENLAYSLGVADRISFVGHVSSLTPHFSEADVFALSSDYEGVPAVVIEALAAGLPVVATDCSVSMASLLGHGTQGILVNVRDEAAFGAALNLAKNMEFSRCRSRAIAARFTIENAASAYAGLMTSMSEQHSVDRKFKSFSIEEMREDNVRSV
jgi:glycosyltransferase involved in cell wall biosynthesis